MEYARKIKNNQILYHNGLKWLVKETLPDETKALDRLIEIETDNGNDAIVAKLKEEKKLKIK
jgi:uncharacterized protein (UPF0128 family)